MANPNVDIQKVINDINYEQQDYLGDPTFILQANSLFIPIMEEGDEAAALVYASTFGGLGKDQYTSYERLTFSTNQAEFDKELATFKENVNNAVRTPATFIRELVENKNVDVNSVGSIKSNSQTILSVSFATQKNVKLLENGFGKNLKWCKIVIKLDDETQRAAVCLRDSIKKVKKIQKDRISEQFDSVFNTPELIPKLYPTSNYTLAASQKASTYDLDKTEYVSDIASYITAVEVPIDTFNAPEATITEKFLQAFKSGVKKILKNANREDKPNGADSYLDLYYSFAKIESYYIAPRIGLLPKILISIPYRNMVAVTDSSRPVVDALYTTLVSGPSRVQNALDSTGGKEIFNFNKFAPNVANALAGGPNVGSQFNYVTEADKLISEDPSTKKYISRDEFRTIEDRKVYIPLRSLPKILSKFEETLRYYSDEVEKELEKDEDNKVYIDMALYADAARQFKNKLFKLADDLFMQYGDESPDNKSAFVFSFKTQRVDSLKLYEDDNLYNIEGSESFIANDPLNDVTFCFFVTNINDIYELDQKNKPITTFFSDYITPITLSKIEYAPGTSDRFIQRELECLKDYKSVIATQLKNNTNKYINDIVSGETIKNIKDDINLFSGGDEYQKMIQSLKEINVTAKKNFLDPKTIQWDAIIKEIVSCIQDKEIRELVLVLLNTLKDFFVNDIPLACQIPRLRLPLFPPSIKLPTIPHLPSLVSSYYSSFANLLVTSRTSIIVDLIKVIGELTELCKLSTDPSTVGNMKAEDLFLDPAQITQTSQAQEAAREKQFKGAGIISDRESGLINEIRSLLTDISLYLTETELVALFYGLPDTQALAIVKNRITFLEVSGVLKNIMPKFGDEKVTYIDEKSVVTLLSNNKVIYFFSLFSKIVDPAAISKIVQKPANVDLLCIETSELDQKNKQALINKGLTDAQAIEEISRRKDEASKKIASIANALVLLSKPKVEAPPANCVRNADGSITPGLSDQLGRPKAFTISAQRTTDALYAKFDEDYNFDISSWVSLTTKDYVQDIANDDGEKEKYYRGTRFMKFFADTINKIDLGSEYGSKIALNYTVPQYAYEKQESESKELLKAADIANNSNKIKFLYEVSDLISKKATQTVKLKSLFVDSKSLYTSEETKKLSSKFGFEAEIDNSRNEESEHILIGELTALDKRDMTLFYFSKIKSRIGDSPCFDTESSGEKAYLISDFKKTREDSKIFNSYIAKLNLNPILTKKEKSCGKKDRRLINNLDSLKKAAMEAAEKSCLPPEISPEGIKLKKSPVDMSNSAAASEMLLRITAIDYILKLLPFGTSVSYLKDDIFFEAIYYLFAQDLKNKFGKSYINIFFEPLLQKYISDEKLDDPQRGNPKSEEFLTVYKDGSELLDNETYKKAAFIKYFKENHFYEVNKSIFSLIREQNLTLTGPDRESIPSPHEVYEGIRKELLTSLAENIDPYAKYPSLLDYEFANLKIITKTSSIINNYIGSDPFYGEIVRPISNGGISRGSTFNFYVKSLGGYKKIYTAKFVDDYKTEFKKFFNEFFTREVPIEDIYSGFVISALLSLSSIQKINSAFDGSRNSLKMIYDIIASASDYTKKIKDTGAAARASRLKVLLALPEFMNKMIAEAMDPNIKLASTLTNAYAAGAVAAEASGVEIKPKSLPLFITSPIVTAATLGFLPPITPMGYIAIASSLKELNITSDDSEDTSEEGDNNC